jgi:hypothetical protein
MRMLLVLVLVLVLVAHMLVYSVQLVLTFNSQAVAFCFVLIVLDVPQEWRALLWLVVFRAAFIKCEPRRDSTSPSTSSPSSQAEAMSIDQA